MSHDTPQRSGHAGDEWAALSDVISGVLLWGVIGWLLDVWLDTRFLVGAGLLVGAALGVLLAYLRYGRS
jgi:ATP synthase protein I